MSMKWWAVAAVLFMPVFFVPALVVKGDDKAPPTDKGGWLGVMFVIEGDKNRAVITDTQPGGPAANAKLQVGDVVLKVGDHTPKGLQEFMDHIAWHGAGEKVTLTIIRDGKEMKVDVTLGQRPGFRPLLRPLPVRP